MIESERELLQRRLENLLALEKEAREEVARLKALHEKKPWHVDLDKAYKDAVYRLEVVRNNIRLTKEKLKA